MGNCTCLERNNHKVKAPKKSNSTSKTAESDDNKADTKPQTPRVNKSKFVKKSLGSLNQNFEILKHLGEGGYGKVYLVRDKRTNIIRAIKEVQKSKTDSQSNQSLLDEVEILKELDHPNIMKIYEVIESSDCYYIVTELLSGGELFDKLLHYEEITEGIAAKYMFDILGALNYCHARGIIHRDLKPENLLFESKDPDSALKIIDFGIASKLLPNSKLSEAIGTIYYMAPEVLEGSYDSKCDIWSAGVILFIMLTGKAPFNGETQADTILQISEGIAHKKKYLKHLSPDAKDLIVSMLNSDPNLRLSAQEALDHPWIQNNINKNIEDLPISQDALSRLGGFRASTELQKSILIFISSQIFGHNEEQELARLFRELDKNGDGKLSREELEDGYKNLKLVSKAQVEEIINNCDTDGSGYIDYSEFLMAATNWNQVFQKEQLRNAFSLYDQSGDGLLSLEELKTSIPGIEDSEWDKFLEDADSDGDGMISLNELKQYLSNKIFN
ncbi:unnamed protein product [Blepharisma stoltei]|uniref:non-specific serine/threonine protein kinase n=1 Tax=Blepharisma stoltei TaxID=1481888 RepID=A0AAU9IW82_9CILI|nr:unnamed protein product [Blepharisma stoltei]